MKLNKIIYSIVITLLFSFTNGKSTRTFNLEKIYTQTDRPLYFPGETIWFKAYITNAANKVTSISDIVNVQLISPKGSVVKTQQLRINQGAAFGNFNLSKDWVGGIYKLRLFTNWMRNLGTTSFFEKELIVQKVVKPKLLMKLDFDKKGYGSKATVIANFEVKDLKNNPLKTTELRYLVQINGETIISKNFTTTKDGKKDITFNLPETLNSTDAILQILIPHQKDRG